MLALVIATVFSASFGLVVRHAQGRKCNLWAVGVINYMAAALFNLVRHLLRGSTTASAPTLALGATAGLLYAVSYGLFFSHLVRRGVAVSTAVSRLAVVVPVLASVLLWHEDPGPQQAIGATLALFSLPLLAFKSIGGRWQIDRAQASSTLAMFASGGMSKLAIRAYGQIGPAHENALFLTVLFGTAFVVTLRNWLRRGGGVAKRDVLPGVVLGLCNALGNAALVVALQQLPGVVVFPFFSAVGLVFAATIARLVWGERVGRVELIGIAVVVLAVLLMNVG